MRLSFWQWYKVCCGRVKLQSKKGSSNSRVHLTRKERLAGAFMGVLLLIIKSCIERILCFVRFVYFYIGLRKTNRFVNLNRTFQKRCETFSDFKHSFVYLPNRTAFAVVNLSGAFLLSATFCKSVWMTLHGPEK